MLLRDKIKLIKQIGFYMFVLITKLKHKTIQHIFVKKKKKTMN